MENDELGESNLGIIRPVNINEEMRGSFLDYAMSVIVARALPDARDGLKPVHRRVLYAMYDMGIRPNTAYKKSARIVGEVLGKYHPHGDASVYDAMARMVQDFSLRYPLVDGQGNFGSLDGDSPAAMRYTEARLAQIAGELLADINMNTVDFVENYDGSQQEPTVLPARMPNLLLNGATGIAVGMATNIPPHNMRELAGAINYIIDNVDRVDDISVDELMQFVKGPDFPTGAKILVGDELREAYATGKGRVIVRATVQEEEHRNGHRLVVTSIPYQVSKQSIIERIVQLVKDGKIDTIRDLRDESDRSGMRLVIEIKPTASFRTVRNQLYKYTQLQTFYSIQMLALVGGEPRNLSLKRALQIFIEHRYDVIVRRSEFELEKQRARAHILMGLLKAVSAIDDVIRIIRNADDVDDARQKLMAFLDLSEAQANAILDMQLRRLAALERQKLQDEYNEVQARIDYLEDLLASPGKILQVVRDDVNEIAEKYGDERKTIIDEESAHLNEEDLYEREEMVITLTSKGYIKRVPSRYYRAQKRGGKGVRGMETKDDDTLLDIVGVNNLDTILFFSDKGKVYSERAFRIPEAQRHTRGVLTQTIINTTMDERITAILPVRSFENRDAVFVMATRQGRIKRVALEEFEAVRPSGLIAISLQEGDELGWVRMSNGNQRIVMVTEGGQSIVFNEDEVRVMGRSAGGVNAMRLINDDVIAGMDVIDPEQHTHIFVVTQNGFGKRTQIEDYTVQSRYGMGIRTLARNDKTGPIVAMRCISDRDGILLITRSGIVLRTDLSEVRETGRSTMGVTIMDLSDGDEVVGIALLSNGSGEADEPELNGEG
jgi:DNA gyrase subunit A